jgi:hypothetical protein
MRVYREVRREVMNMKKRFRLSKKSSNKKFGRSGKSTHKYNVSKAPMRGGIRL